MKLAAVFLLLAVPATALAQGAGSTTLELSQKAAVGGASVPLHATVSAGSDVVLSQTNQEGAVPVTITFYIAPKPQPAVAAAVESSQNIQNSIGGVSPQAEGVLAPVFRLVDGGRQAAADALDNQLDATRAKIGPAAQNPGEVLGAEQTKNAASNPLGAFLFILQTLYFYLLTILRFIVGSAGVFYPVAAAALLYVLWTLFKRFRRPAY